MRRTSSGASGGRPIGRDFHAQNRANPRRCHTMTVAGWTIASVSDHRDHRRQTTTQNARSMGRSRGRGVARRRIASCWRSTRFSATRLARGRRAASNAPTTASRSASIPRSSRQSVSLSPANRPGRRGMLALGPCSPSTPGMTRKRVLHRLDVPVAERGVGSRSVVESLDGREAKGLKVSLRAHGQPRDQ